MKKRFEPRVKEKMVKGERVRGKGKKYPPLTGLIGVDLVDLFVDQGEHALAEF